VTRADRSHCHGGRALADNIDRSIGQLGEADLVGARDLDHTRRANQQSVMSKSRPICDTVRTIREDGTDSQRRVLGSRRRTKSSERPNRVVAATHPPDQTIVDESAQEVDGGLG
jgi:hypothetical protein